MFLFFVPFLFAAPEEKYFYWILQTLLKKKINAALIVSIEDYALVSDVKGANRNGEDWYEYLSKQQGIPTKNIKWLQDDQASKEAI